MTTDIQIWRLAAGLGLFLFGMRLLELALTNLAGRSFKQFLKASTDGAVRGVVAGAATTAALQSSSVVSLIVLAFVGSELINLPAALAIVFGSNVGTTVTGWIVATLGFRLDIEALSLPLVAIGGLTIVWSRHESRLAHAGTLVAGFGLMLLGLDFMKSGAEQAATLFDPEALADYPLIAFVLAGLLVTALIQSSSATIMLALSAIYVGIIELDAAAAVAIGADLGTTITAVLGALAGSDDKKRVALAIFIFNFVTNLIAFVFLEPLLGFVGSVLGIGDPLLALVAFHTLFNTLGVLVFLPLIQPLSRWLSRRFVDDGDALTRHIKPGAIEIPEAAVENVRRESLRLLDQAAAINLATFRLPTDHRFYDVGNDRESVEVFERNPDLDTAYAALKELEGELLAYALELQRRSLEPAESAQLGRLIPALRNAVHSAKSTRDIQHDLERFRNSVNDRFNAYLGQFREAMRDFYEAASRVRAGDNPQLCFENLVKLKHVSRSLHERMHRRIYDEVTRGELSRGEVSTLLNVNREVYASNQSMLAALADLMLGETSAEDFASLPESSRDASGTE
ncbi:MAG: Na/Pi symporter [Woeseiaceae bacterium]|jgi:phosphate:Na+ symporter|nr:Na/Pi symporter [Woeseiaceae bacterium]